jgi:hypothetical protein
MTDIVERLRHFALGPRLSQHEIRWLHEAADEIARLRALTDCSIKDQIIARHLDAFMKQEAEIERLLAEIERLREKELVSK